jgi:hypothetical protein
MTMMRDCFEPASASFVCCDGVAATVDGAVVGERFFADFDIEILRSAHGGVPPHRRSPTSALTPAGRISQAPPGARNDDNYRSGLKRMTM